MRRRGVIVGILAAALLLPGAGLPANAQGPATGSPPATGTGLGVPTAAPTAVPRDSWCRVVLPQPSSSGRRATRIMAGRVEMGMYGWFPLAQSPAWQPVRTLDASGNTHMHGLHWAIPLLYHGSATGDRAMVDRFYGLLGSWLAAFPPEQRRPGMHDQHIVAGQRLWTLTCASEQAAAAQQDAAQWSAALRAETSRQLDRFAVGPGTNNVVVYSQSAALAASCLTGDAADAQRALQNLEELADHLVLPDGSDLEGSPHYAFHTYQLLGKGTRIADRCGLPHDRLDAAMARAQEFLAFATRPDGVLETLGDSPGSRMPLAQLPEQGPAAFAATSGDVGEPPSDRYRVFAGGYAFGRSWWRAPRKVKGATPATATFYSFRTGKGPAPTAHTHSDIGSVTISAAGIRWIGDPGPWRYDGSALRREIRTRAAHSALTVEPLPPRRAKRRPPSPDPTASPSPTRTWRAPRPVPDSRLTRSRTGKRSDVTCIEDLTYPTAAISRCVTFRRDTRTLVVEDRIEARERSRIRGRWQVPPRVKVTRKGRVVTLRAGSERARISLGGSPTGTLSRSRSWFTVSYGVKARGTTIQRTVDLEKGQTATWRMVFRVT